MSGHLRTTTIATLLLFASVAVAAAAPPPFELTVKRDQVLGKSKGTLLFGTDVVEYRTTDKDDARSWRYDDVKQVQILSPTRVTILTYEDRGHLAFGRDREFEFTVVNGLVSPDLVTFLLERITRPVVTAVMPHDIGEPLFRVRVKHERQGRGSEGTLLLFDRQLLYLSEREGESRFWRFSDIASVLRLTRYRLQVTAYEGGGDSTRLFVFDLKSELPPGFYEALWAHVNPPQPQTGDTDINSLAAEGR